jgi:CRISPR system Cascade subunit CasE
MYLSCLELDYRNPAVRQCLKNCQDMHRTIMKAMPQYDAGPARQTGSVLYRVMDKDDRTCVYVLCNEKPDWQQIAAQGFSSKLPKDVSGIVKAFLPGARFTFDLAACPAKKQSVPDGNSKRVFLSSEEERRGWLDRKAEQNGFRVDWVREEGQVKQFGAHGGENGGAMWHTGVRFRGKLTVIDQQAFAKAFAGGIGAGKAYGFGLLLLFRPVVKD